MFRRVAEIKITHFFGDDAVELFELLEREGYIVEHIKTIDDEKYFTVLKGSNDEES